MTEAQGIVSDACSSWLEAGCTPGSLGVELLGHGRVDFDLTLAVE